MPRKTRAKILAESEQTKLLQEEEKMANNENENVMSEELSQDSAEELSQNDTEELPQDGVEETMQLSDAEIADINSMIEDDEAIEEEIFNEEIFEVETADKEPTEEESSVEETLENAIVEDIPEEQPVKKKSNKSEKSLIPTKKITTKSKKATEKQLQARSVAQAFYKLNFKELDRFLSPEQRQEWSSIYASFRSKSILSGIVSGVDEHTFDVTDENGLTVRQIVRSLVIINFRVKVLIPESELWAIGEERPEHVIRSMVGAKVDYVIMNVEREGDCAIASRRMAMTKRKRAFRADVGELVNTTILVVGAKKLLLHCGGFDIILSQRDLSYTAIADLRNFYKTGQELLARVIGKDEKTPVISVKEVNPNPFDGAEDRHPIGSRRQAVIAGKYGGGVFCRLPDDVTSLCLYSNDHDDAEFNIDDRVLIYVSRYDYNKKLMYARIISKW